ncbi:replication initiator protein A [Deinococcus antarcticus]|uniref:Replication initiator protein A n=1 Tax=Deinococcus antarcticus TaxID=1298767 RepID=A0ABV8A3A0_9DEIO
MSKAGIRNATQIRDTRSLARFGITSMQVRLDEEESKRWVSQFVIAGRSYQMQGFADLGRPRGADTDVILGVEALFAVQGFPQDNTVVTSGYQLAQAAHLPDNGRTYERLRDSLLRYWRTGFIVREGFEVPGQEAVAYYNETLGFFEKISFWEQGQRGRGGDLAQGSLSRDKTLRVVLTPEFADSLRSGFIHHLDRELLRNIEQPPARALYRLLSAHRQTDEGHMQDSLTVSLQDWREACGLQDSRASKVMRALAAAHDELTALGYLTAVDTIGRGQKMELVYHFRKSGDPDPVLVQQLLDANLGLSLVVAQQLAREYAPHVEHGIQFVKNRQAAVANGGKPVVNPAGLLRSALKEPDRYLLTEVQVRPEGTVKPSRKSQEALKRQEQAAQEELETQALELQELPAHLQWQKCRTSLKLLLQRKLTSDEWKTLEQRCVVGELSAATLLSAATHAAATLDLQDYVTTLKFQLK